VARAGTEPYRGRHPKKESLKDLWGVEPERKAFDGCAAKGTSQLVNAITTKRDEGGGGRAL